MRTGTPVLQCQACGKLIQHGVFTKNGASGMNKHLNTKDCKSLQSRDSKQSVIQVWPWIVINLFKQWQFNDSSSGNHGKLVPSDHILSSQTTSCRQRPTRISQSIFSKLSSLSTFPSERLTTQHWWISFGSWTQTFPSHTGQNCEVSSTLGLRQWSRSCWQENKGIQQYP